MIVPRPYPTATDIPITLRTGWSVHLVTAVVWSVFVGFHAVALLYFGLSSFCYGRLQGNGASEYLAVYRIGIASQHYHVVALVYGSIAAINLGLLLKMVVMSVRRQRFIFAYQFTRANSATSDRKTAHTVVRLLPATYQALFSSTGFFGVSGPCFDLLLLLRETLETILQTVQAHRMSQYLARAWFNRFYVGLLVLNCWLMALVHTLFHRSPTTRYFVTMLFDLMLDFVSSIIVPVVLITIYAPDADMNSPSIFGLKWYEDVWLTNAMNEFQLVLITSWVNLASRLMFALSMIGTLNTLKRFASEVTDTRSKHGWRQRWNLIVPDVSTVQILDDRKASALQLLVRANNTVKTSSLTKLQRIVFAVWGTAVLALYLSSEMARDLPQCVMQVRPWGITQPSCNLVLINCYRDGINGATAEIHERLYDLHPPSMTTLMVRHCPSFEMPPIIQSFPNLKMLKIYNSTVVKWYQDAALTESSHPSCSLLDLTRVRFLNREIPPGLLADDFPPTINIFGFFDTNIRSLPNDLDSKWTPGSIIHFDTAQLTEVPDVLLRLRPKILDLSANPIHKVPSELFQMVGNAYIGLSDTGISELPTNVTTPSTTLASFNLDGTNVSSFPLWVDQWLTFPGETLYPERISASGSPYCVERGGVFSGELATFVSPTNSRLMDVSSSNWEYLKRGVSYVPTQMYRYTMWMDDMFSALQ